jgi:hypothetical protein
MSNLTEDLALPYRQAIMNDEVPLSIGGGIEQAQTYMYRLRAAQRIQILCDKGPAQHEVVPGITAAIEHRLGRWSATARERHGGHCWDVRIHPPDGPERHCVFLGGDLNVEYVRRTIEDALVARATALARHTRGGSRRRSVTARPALPAR